MYGSIFLSTDGFAYFSVEADRYNGRDQPQETENSLGAVAASVRNQCDVKRLKHLSEPPEDLSQLRKLLFRALKAGRAPGFSRLQQICENGILNQDFVGVRTP